MKLILASSSPRRKALLSEYVTDDFFIMPSSFDERTVNIMDPYQLVDALAKGKGEVISISHQDNVVISSDTIVVFDNEIIGKPKSKEDAFNILSKLSGNKHIVITSYCIFYQGKMHQNHVVSEVYFNQLSNELINSYIATNSPMDKAGAYGIQDNEKFPIVNRIKGSLHNIIGFPIEEIKKDLIELGLSNLITK